MLYKGVPRILHWVPMPKGRKSRPKAESAGGVSWGGGYQLGGMDERCELPQRDSGLFIAFTIASPIS